MKKLLITAALFLALPAVAGAWYYPSYPYSSYTGQGYYTGAGMDPHYYGFGGSSYGGSGYNKSCYYSNCGSYGGGSYGGGYGGYSQPNYYSQPRYNSYTGYARYQNASPTINIYAPQPSFGSYYRW